mmetsp:Transcript_30221/g.70267  ORF Transcript_30221/g.70267 Transcript_30221/m.70267 type:complete len:211 (+) Transcript_30221:85-717(+)
MLRPVLCRGLHPSVLLHSRTVPAGLPPRRQLAASQSVAPASALAELSQAATTGSLDAMVGASASAFEPPPGVEEARDRLRRRGLEAERDDSKREEVLAEAVGLLTAEHALVRLAAIHTVARVAALGDCDAWECVGELVQDPEELVRVGALRAIGRIAKPGDVEALELLVRVQREAKSESTRCAAKDAEARLRGTFGLPGAGTHPLLGGGG